MFSCEPRAEAPQTAAGSSGYSPTFFVRLAILNELSTAEERGEAGSRQSRARKIAESGRGEKTAKHARAPGKK